MYHWKYTADPLSVEFLETLQQDQDQALMLSTHGQIILMDSAGRKLRCWSALQREEALRCWFAHRGDVVQ